MMERDYMNKEYEGLGDSSAEEQFQDILNSVGGDDRIEQFTEETPMGGEPKKKKKKKPLGLRVIKNVAIWLLTFILALVVCLVGVVFVFEKGPSQSIRDVFVMTVTQTSAAKFAAHMFLSEETVASILEENTVKDNGQVTDGEMIVIGGGDEEYDLNAITVEDISGSTYKGKVMIINDPSRVYVHAIPDFNAYRGDRVQHMCELDGAVGGINGGGFEDIAGLGKGARALGIVVANGVWRNGDKGATHQVIGFDNENKLIVGSMTGNAAIEAGIRDAVAWGPVLIVNGEALDVGSSGGGLNPRTAIGQRADGSVIMVVIDGRQPNSLGGSYADLIDVMLRYGAVNAANLDGGTSTSMVYNGEIINSISSLYGERSIPTAFLIKKAGEADE